VVLSAADLIRAVRDRGGQFLIDGDRLGVIPRTAAEPFAEQIRQHKAELMAELSRRPTMPVGVRLASWNPKAAPVRLSECSTVTDTERFIGTTLAQLDAKLIGKSWPVGNWPLSTLIERLAAVGVEIALDDPKKALQ